MQLSSSTETATGKEVKQLVPVGSVSTDGQIPMYEVGGTALTITVSIGLAQLPLGRREMNEGMIQWSMPVRDRVSRQITQPAGAALLTDLVATAGDTLGTVRGES
jgi:hypothetical protein